jgi:hypothetical protein
MAQPLPGRFEVAANILFRAFVALIVNDCTPATLKDVLSCLFQAIVEYELPINMRVFDGDLLPGVVYPGFDCRRQESCWNCTGW